MPHVPACCNEYLTVILIITITKAMKNTFDFADMKWALGLIYKYWNSPVGR